MKIFAPYPNFRFKHMTFRKGHRHCSDSEVKELKKVPLKVAKFKTEQGLILNKPKPKKKKKSK